VALTKLPIVLCSLHLSSFPLRCWFKFIINYYNSEHNSKGVIFFSFSVMKINNCNIERMTARHETLELMCYNFLFLFFELRKKEISYVNDRKRNTFPSQNNYQ